MAKSKNRSNHKERVAARKKAITQQKLFFKKKAKEFWKDYGAKKLENLKQKILEDGVETSADTSIQDFLIQQDDNRD